jgi:hypothetical protein
MLRVNRRIVGAAVSTEKVFLLPAIQPHERSRVALPDRFLPPIPVVHRPQFLAVMLPPAIVLAFIYDLYIVAVRIQHPGRIIAGIVFETSLR